MWYVKDNYAAVWKVEDKGSYTEVQMTTSRKDASNGTYKNSSWGFVKFVKSAHDKAKADGLKRGDRILVKEAAIGREPYEKDGKTFYPKNESIAVFKYEMNVPKVKDQTEEELENSEIPF